MKIAIAGLGTVGAGTLQLLDKNAQSIAVRAQRDVVVTAVSARERNKDRGIDISTLDWFDDPVKMATEADADIVVELIGGSDGVARATCEAALSAARHVVTANKALLAHHGVALASRAEEVGKSLQFEAAVAGAIPIVKCLREGLSANSVNKIIGILNGTSNYILSRMRLEELEFDAVLFDAQELGYAEADPSFDIDGVDAAHKLSIMASLAFGAPIEFDSVHIEGIRHVSLLDIQFAQELGYRVKLLGIAAQIGDGIEQRIHPCLVPETAAIANVEFAFNAVEVDCDFANTIIHVGPGAGAGPTASAVVADIIDIARGHRVPPLNIPTSELSAIPTVSMESHRGGYYVRLMVVDEPGVFAEIAAILGKHTVSMESVLQRGRAPGEPVPLVMTVHETTESNMTAALDEIGNLSAVSGNPCMIRIELLEA